MLRVPIARQFFIYVYALPTLVDPGRFKHKFRKPPESSTRLFANFLAFQGTTAEQFPKACSYRQKFDRLNNELRLCRLASKVTFIIDLKKVTGGIITCSVIHVYIRVSKTVILL